MEIDNDDQTLALFLHQGVNNFTLVAKGSEQQNNNIDQNVSQEIPLAAFHSERKQSCRFIYEFCTSLRYAYDCPRIGGFSIRVDQVT